MTKDVEHPDLIAAAETWNEAGEDVEGADLRIHGGVPKEKLAERADRFVSSIFELFPYVRVGPSGTIMEVGSGTGQIMEAMNRAALRIAKKSPRQIIGLDIAEHMLAKAKERLGEVEPYHYMHYDGLHVPMDNDSIDLVYSVAAMQHVPKLYVYNLLFEIHRILKPTGFCVIHLLSFRELGHLQTTAIDRSWRDQVSRQIQRKKAHWLHFYSKEELENVLYTGTGFLHVDVRDEGRHVWLCARKLPFTLGPGLNPFR